MKSRGETAAIVQQALDETQSRDKIMGLLGKVNEAEAYSGVIQDALRDWRLLIGAELRVVRKNIPERGPHAKKWTAFIESCGIAPDSAANYMKAADVAERYPVEAAAMSLTDMYRLKRGSEPPHFPNSSGKVAGEQPLLTARTDTPPAAPPEPRPFTETLFGGAPDTGEAPRTADPGATTIVATEDQHDQTRTPEAAPADEERGPELLHRGVPELSHPLRGDDGSADGGALEQVGGEGLLAGVDGAEHLRPAALIRPAAAKPDDPYEISERIALLKTSPVSKVPDEDKASFAAALREWADSLHALTFDGTEVALDRLTKERDEHFFRADKAEARVRELEQERARLLALADSAQAHGAEIGASMNAEALAAKDATIRDALDRLEDAARRGYQQGEAEALAWCAVEIGGIDEEIAEGLRDRIAERIFALRGAEARALAIPEGQAAQPRPGAQDGPVLTRPEGEDSPAAAPAQAELTYEPDPDLQRRPPKKAARVRAEPKIPKSVVLPSKWHVGDQVLFTTKDGERRAVVAFKRPDGGLHIVLRADRARNLKASAPPAWVSADKLRPDPALSADDRKRAIAEAIECLEGISRPPETWIEALREAGKVA